MGLPSGIGPMKADECQIAPVPFKAFVDALLAWHRRTSHTVMAALAEGFVATVLVLAERAGIEVNWQPAGYRSRPARSPHARTCGDGRGAGRDPVLARFLRVSRGPPHNAFTTDDARPCSAGGGGSGGGGGGP
ncbi:DUF6086 family protein [Streptomyces nigrescens]|uniref:DUF6086 family protein n=1 Tax=Streptomyces nigrescens TaxID=1920 RepID=UPI00368E8926